MPTAAAFGNRIALQTRRSPPRFLALLFRICVRPMYVCGVCAYHVCHERKPRRVDYDPRAKFRTHRRPRTGRCRASRPKLVMQIANMGLYARCQCSIRMVPPNHRLVHVG